MNLTVIAGRLSRPASIRELGSGTRVLGLEVTTDRHREGEQRGSVPVVWRDPPSSAELLDEGDDVVVLGRVNRRFFKSGGSTQSRTEVEADVVLRARQGARIKRALAEARNELESALDS